MASGGHRSELFALLVDLNFPGQEPIMEPALTIDSDSW